MKHIFVSLAIVALLLSGIRQINAACLSFNGFDSYVEVQDSPRLSGGSGRSLTFEAWIFPIEIYVNQRMNIISKYKDWNNKDWGMFIKQDDGLLAFQKETWSLPGCQRGNWYTWSTESISANQWSHVAFVFDNDNDVVNVFINGILTGQRELIDCDLPDTNAVVWLGGPGPFYYTYGTEMFIGYIDEVRIWDVARTEIEIFDNMFAGNITGGEQGLVAYWDFEPDQNPGILYDRTSNSNNGAIFDATWSEKNAPLETIDVNLDIKPRSCPNPLNVKSKGVLPIAILGTQDFDVTDIDPATVQLEGVAPVRWALEDVSTPVSDPQDDCDCTEEGGDGFADLTLKYKNQEIVVKLGEVNDGDELVLTLTGELLDGTTIEGYDCIVVLKKGK